MDVDERREREVANPPAAAPPDVVEEQPAPVESVESPGAALPSPEGGDSSAAAAGGSGDRGDVPAEEASDSIIRPEDLVDENEPDVEEEPSAGPVEPIEELPTEEPPEEEERKWYILKVQSNREKSICDALQRRVAVAGLQDYFGEIIVPTEDVAEFKNGKRRVVKRKLYPGYIVINMVLNDETWFSVRETPGIGDFTGAAGKPTPMLSEEVERIVRAAHPEEEHSDQIKTAIPFHISDRVRIKDGIFENFEGELEGIDETNGRVTVTINIFGRSTPVELEHWQVEAV